MLELDSDQRFAEPVALSSTQPVDRPLPRRAFRQSLNLVALRARRIEKPKRSSSDGQVPHANEFNDENIFVLGSVCPKTPEGHQVDAARCETLAKHMKAEIERIIPNSNTYAP